ncbi:MAG: LPS export ABC transporter ATP-binding protein [Methylococcales bacterium]|nr:LPS export ABC transporter ATP-binding protein [Methylococcales bacterium]
MATLIAKHLLKTYNKRNVVNGVSLHVDTGEIVGLLGPNGAGKTTCFYMMVGLIKVDEGDIYIDNKLVTHFPMHSRARLGVGYLPQESSVFRKLTVADNLRAVLQLRKNITRKQIATITAELLDELSITHLKDQKALGLSGGERRRLEIARALATNPQFILLDEPFAGVDPISVIDINKIIVHLKERDIGILITEHNVRETLGICDRAYILNEGKVIAEGSSHEIVNNEEVRKVYLGEGFTL